MPRSPEYQRFLDIHYGKVADSDPDDLETTATEQEIGWWKQQQFRRALHNARAGEATETELIYLAKRGHYFRDTPKEFIQKPLTIWERRKKAQAGEASDEDLKVLAKAGYFYPTTPEEYVQKYKPKNTKK